MVVERQRLLKLLSEVVERIQNQVWTGVVGIGIDGEVSMSGKGSGELERGAGPLVMILLLFFQTCWGERVVLKSCVFYHLGQTGMYILAHSTWPL